ncbi:hypothetical protein AVEN_176349-1 [Araneus ventricosus]|uniref:Uncharacterized protein n=1 Tax=Araneus ventricosus TaxID=182803 RepID=A0A4Y2C8V0_ARAVE|nr:hypothetical protein AVEN_176349-1 [Araneus ventricosus]
MVQRVEDIILSNGRVSVAHTAQDLGISVGSRPCDFHAFCKLKEHLGGRQFSSDDQAQQLFQAGSRTKERFSIVRTSND